MTLVRTVIVMALLGLAGPVVAGGAVHVGFGFHGGGFHGGGHGGPGGGFGFGFGGGFHHGGGGFHFGGLPVHHPGFGVHGFFPGPHAGPWGKGRLVHPRYAWNYPGYYDSRSSYNRYGWRKWYTYTDFSQINYPGVYPVPQPRAPADRLPE